VKPRVLVFDRTPEKVAALRLWRHVQKSEGCWMWTGPTDGGRYPYPRASVPSIGVVGAHRAVYELLVGPIPDGLTLDHLCRHPMCVRPDHMEPVTLRENVLRGNGPPARNARKTVCKWGHPLIPGTYYVAGDGQRLCKECRRLRNIRIPRRPKKAAA
jgi:hypothetical protein